LRGGAGFAGVRRDALDRVFQIARGKLVLRVVAGNGDENFGRQIGGWPEMRFARRGQQLDLRLGRAENREQGTGNRRNETKRSVRRGNADLLSG
jgi:hypothetical protein